jgi:glycosyltransferase involved in cell wall biosynthesis
MADLMLYTHSFAGGGAERVMVQLANEWAGRGYEVVFVVNRDVGPLRADLRAEVDLRVTAARPTQLAFLPLVQIMGELRPRATISAMNFCNVSAGLAHIITGKRGKLLVVEHTDLSLAYRFMPLHQRLYLRTFMPVSYSAATVVAGVSIDVAESAAKFARLNADAAIVLNNPVWPARGSRRSPEQVHPWFAQPIPVLVTAGRMTVQKNHKNLLAALALLRMRTEVRLIMLGDGPLRQETQERVAELGLGDAVALLGHQEEVDDFIRLSSCFVLSSDVEGFPLVLLEAMRHGVPLVSTHCSSGPIEILENGKLGVLVPPRNAEALASGIQEAMRRPVPAEKLKKKVEGYEISLVAASYLRSLEL